MDLQSLLKKNHLEALVSQAFKRKRKGSGARRWTDFKVKHISFQKEKKKAQQNRGKEGRL